MRKILLLFGLLISFVSYGQLNGTFKTLRLTPAQDTTTLNLPANEIYYPVGTIIRELTTDSLYMKYSDAPNYWGPVGGGGGSGGATNPAGSNNMVQYNASGSFGANAKFIYRRSTDLFILGDTTFLSTYWARFSATTTSNGFQVGHPLQGNSSLTPHSLAFNPNYSYIEHDGDTLEIRSNGNIVIGPSGSGADTVAIGATPNAVGADPVIIFNTAIWSQYVIDQNTTSTAGGTITLDQNNQFQRSFVGSATFATPKTLAQSNVITTANTFSSFNFFFEVTNVAAVLTFPADWISSNSSFDGTDWTPPFVGKYEFGGSYNNVDDTWNIKIDGPTQ